MVKGRSLRISISRPAPSQMSGVTLDELLDKVGVKSTQLEEVCSDEHLRIIAQSLESWRELSVHLGLFGADVEVIEGDRCSVPVKRQQMLKKWREKFDFKATYRVLIEGLLSIGNAKMAHTVCLLVKQQSNVRGKFLFVYYIYSSSKYPIIYETLYLITAMSSHIFETVFQHISSRKSN